LPQNVILELSWHDAKIAQGKAYVGWSGLSSKVDHSETIEIDPQFGEAIGLHNGQKIYVKNFSDILPETSIVVVEPISSDDWEIIGPCAKLSEGVQISVPPKLRNTKNSAEIKDIASNGIFNARIYCLRVLPRAFLFSDLLQPSANDFCTVYIHLSDLTRIGLPNPKI
ncbi:4878_t:CDS:2, partial [Gigaspora margarita]